MSHHENNIVEIFYKKAFKLKDKIALFIPRKSFFRISYSYQNLTFGELKKKSEGFATAFSKAGVKPQSKVIVFLKPGIEFPAVTFALFHLGAIPIFIDPGMGLRNLFGCIKKSNPDFFVGISFAVLLRILFFKHFKMLKKTFWISKFRPDFNNSSPPVYKPQENDLSAILFTSGGTGAPKGVEYTHEILIKQTHLLQQMFNLTPDDIDVPGFPLFSLFTLSMGMSSCPPDLNAAKPSKLNPKKVVKNILDTKATYLAGSPAIWDKVANYCLKKRIILPHVRHLVTFGAPVPPEFHEKFKLILTHGESHTPYGATECLPVSTVSGTEIILQGKQATRTGHGTLIGKPVNGVKIKIIPISDMAFEKMPNELSPGSIGEILVTGPTVTKAYYNNKEATDLSKIVDVESEKTIIWHRMGDLGKIDSSGNIWFCGRKVHRIEDNDKLITSDQVEGIVKALDEVKECALISVKVKNKIIPAIAIQRRDGKILNKSQLQSYQHNVIEYCRQFKESSDIQKVYMVKSFPVDVRHNIKIDRLLVSKWASENKLQGVNLS